jgi:sugar-phosphatase
VTWVRVAALISDMDGVLVDTAGVYDRHWARWARHHGVSPERIGAVHFGRPAAETIRLVAPELDAVLEARRFNEALADDPDAAGVSAMPGALGLASAIPADRWAIATSAPRIMAERWLLRIGLPMPSVLVTVEDVVRGKPAPDPYLRAAELLGVAADQCLVLEDAPAGISAAKSAGATVLGLLSTHRPGDLAMADHLVEALDHVTVSLDGPAGADPDGSSLLFSWHPAPR